MPTGKACVSYGICKAIESADEDSVLDFEARIGSRLEPTVEPYSQDAGMAAASAFLGPKCLRRDLLTLRITSARRIHVIKMD